MRSGSLLVAVLAWLLVVSSPALADEGVPHAAAATWTYEWADGVSNPTPTKEQVTVRETKGATFEPVVSSREASGRPWSSSGARPRRVAGAGPISGAGAAPAFRVAGMP